DARQNHDSESVRKICNCESDRRGADGFAQSTAGNPSSKQASPGYIVHRQTSQRSSVSSPKRFKLEETSIPVLNCFAHWTHSVTGGYLMMEDLEIYSESVPDEAGEALIKSAKIHCLDVTRFLPWNLGKPGIRRYFQKHKCNNWCKDMRLQRVLIEKADSKIFLLLSLGQSFLHPGKATAEGERKESASLAATCAVFLPDIIILLELAVCVTRPCSDIGGRERELNFAVFKHGG
ncbi:hypothetical protein BOX15_Mlig003895g1, partial [Macrostomum lignano]